MNVITLTIGIAIIVFAGFTQGLTSFGFALISMPVLSAFIPLKTVVPIIVILSLFSNLAVLLDAWRHIKIRNIWLLVLSSLTAAPLGAQILSVVDASVLKIFIGLFIIFFSLLLLNGKAFRVRNEQWACIPVGFASGLLNGSISLSGPPIALFMSNQGADKQVFRANITFYAILLNIITVVTFWYKGLIPGEVVHHSLWFLPAMFIGVHFGVRTLRLISETGFKIITLFLLILSGSWTFLTGLGSL